MVVLPKHNLHNGNIFDALNIPRLSKYYLKINFHSWSGCEDLDLQLRTRGQLLSTCRCLPLALRTWFSVSWIY